MIDILKQKRKRMQKAKRRCKGKLKTSPDRPRMVVFKSRKYLYVQVVDDLNQKILVSLSSIAKEMKEKKLGKNIASAKILGKTVGQKLNEKKIGSVAFDRNGFKYHGKIKALAEACRGEGIKF
jgi:large subunit ribosomal protein L18